MMLQYIQLRTLRYSIWAHKLCCEGLLVSVLLFVPCISQCLRRYPLLREQVEKSDLWATRLKNKCASIWDDFAMHQSVMQDFQAWGGISNNDIDETPYRFRAQRTYTRLTIDQSGLYKIIDDPRITSSARFKGSRLKCFGVALSQAAQTSIGLPKESQIYIAATDGDYSSSSKCRPDANDRRNMHEWESVCTAGWFNPGRPSWSPPLGFTGLHPLGGVVLSDVGSAFGSGIPLLDGSELGNCNRTVLKAEFRSHSRWIELSQSDWDEKWKQRIALPYFRGSRSSPLRESMAAFIKSANSSVRSFLANVSIGSHFGREGYIGDLLTHKYLIDMGGAGPWSRRIIDLIHGGGIILQHVRSYVHYQRLDYPIKHLIVPWRRFEDLMHIVKWLEDNQDIAVMAARHIAMYSESCTGLEEEGLAWAIILRRIHDMHSYTEGKSMSLERRGRAKPNVSNWTLEDARIANLPLCFLELSPIG